MGHLLYLSLGTNQGNRHALLQQAINLLEQRVGLVEAVSSFIETEPWGFDSPNKFLNAAIRMRTTLSPLDVLLTTQQIERELGRTKKSTPVIEEASSNKASSSLPTYRDRPIDIDILLYDNLHLDETYNIDGQPLRLTIPHPLMFERDFVMIPLREVLGKTETLY